MTWLVQLFRPKPALPPPIGQAVKDWHALPSVEDETLIERTRFVVVDVETSGLNPRRDTLLSIGAVVIEGMRLAPRDTFSIVLRNTRPSSRANVLVHGLTPSMQLAGELPAQALSEYLRFVGKSPCVAFHAGFDRSAIELSLRNTFGMRANNPWLDLARLAPRLVPQAHLPLGSLDDWLAYFRLQPQRRHEAVYDAQVTAELFLMMLARARLRGIRTLGALRALCDAEHGFSIRGDISGV